MKKLGFKPLISSDCHDRMQLDCAFDLAEAMVKEAGFEEIWVLQGKKFVPIPIEK